MQEVSRSRKSIRVKFKCQSTLTDSFKNVFNRNSIFKVRFHVAVTFKTLFMARTNTEKNTQKITIRFNVHF